MGVISEDSSLCPLGGSMQHICNICKKPKYKYKENFLTNKFKCLLF